METYLTFYILEHHQCLCGVVSSGRAAWWGWWQHSWTWAPPGSSVALPGRTSGEGSASGQWAPAPQGFYNTQPKIQDAVCCFFISHWSYNQSIKVDEIIRSHCDILAKVNKSGLKCLTYSLHKLPDSVYTIHAYIFIINTLWQMKFWKILIHVQEPVRLDHIYR